MTADPLSIVVMGVSGSGKSTVAARLAADLNADYLDGDWLHPADNISKMAKGEPLDDDDRQPWLRAIGDQVNATTRQGGRSVVACSALKRAYRDVLRAHVPTLFFVFLDGSFELIKERMETRTHEFMAPSMLESQFAILEPLESDEYGQRVECSLDPAEISFLVRSRLAVSTIALAVNTSEVGP